VTIIKPTQNTKTVQIHGNKTLNRQNKNNIAEKSNIKEILGQKPYTLKKTIDTLI
jgi:hypothetical protein